MSRSRQGKDAAAGETKKASRRPLYDVLGLDQGASQDDIRKAYRKLALQLHPDKNKTDEAKERFQDLQRVYGILGDAEKRKVYDDTGETDADAGAFSSEAVATMAQYFRSLYTEVTPAEIERVEREYRGSEEEAADVLRCYTQHEGDMRAVFDCVICSEPNWDEHRFLELLEARVAAGEAPRFPAFGAWARRVRRRARPPGDALRKGQEGGGSGDGMSALVAAIRKRGAPEQDTFFSSLEAKYCGAGKGEARGSGSTKGRKGRRRAAEAEEEEEADEEEEEEGVEEPPPRQKKTKKSKGQDGEEQGPAAAEGPGSRARRAGKKKAKAAG